MLIGVGRCRLCALVLGMCVRACMHVNEFYVPIAHVLPPYPGAHVHVNALIPSVHVAQFRQGFELHSLMSETGKRY